MANIMSMFGGFNMMNIVWWIVWIIVLLIVGAVVTGLVIFFMIKSKEKMIIELNQINRRFIQFSGRERKNKSGRLQLWMGKLKRFLPRLQQEDIFLKGKKDVVILLKDNNGLYHSLRIPNEDELKKWYKAVHGIDLDAKVQEINDELTKEGIEDENEQKLSLLDKIKNKFQGGTVVDRALTILGTVYLLPNPLEDLNWCAEQAIEADKTFAAEWWKSPAFVWVATLGLLVVLTIMWLIIMKKM